MFAFACVEYGDHVAGDTDMRCGVATVGCDGYLEDIVVFHIEVFVSWHTHGSIVGEDNDAVVAVAQLKFVFGAEHTLADSATELTLFDFVIFRVGGPYLGANLGANHFLTCGNIGSATNDV